jgi:hypothetical protein
MGRGQGEEKQFNAQLDRLLNGYDTGLEGSVDDDLGTALKFARKMVNLRPDPSRVFEVRLREKLTAQLESQSARNQGWISRLISHQPIWQAAAGVVVVLVIASLLWLTGIFDSSRLPVSPTTTTPAMTTPATTTTAPTTTRPAATAPTTTATTTTTATVAPTTTKPPIATSGPKVYVSANTNKASFSSGEPVIIDVTLQNAGPESLKIEKYPPILSLMQSETKQPVYTFTAGSGTANLAPDGKTSFTLIWHQQDYKGAPVSPGIYYLELEDLDYQGQTVKLTLSNIVYFSIY